MPLSLIFELFLQLRSLTVRTTGGDIRVTRVFARGIATEADPMLAGILGDDQAVTGIVFRHQHESGAYRHAE